MKKLLLLVFFLFISSFTFAQWDWSLDFDDTTYLSRVTIDTSSNPNCIWQMGRPSKILFDSAYTFPNAIITDTINPYPINDTSSFIITHERPFQGGSNFLLLNFYFKINADSLTDYGLVEASLDDGTTWINLLTEDITYQLFWLAPKPVLTGNSVEWVHYAEGLSPLTYTIGWSPTILYRFTFISDSVQSNKDGWMLDHFFFEDSWEGIDDPHNDNLISINPNPVSTTITLSLPSNQNTMLSIFNLLGEKVKEEKVTGTQVTLDVSSLPQGLYFVRMENRVVGKFVKE